MSASGRIALKLRLDDDLLKALRPAWIPAGILVVTALPVRAGDLVREAGDEVLVVLELLGCRLAVE